MSFTSCMRMTLFLCAFWGAFPGSSAAQALLAPVKTSDITPAETAPAAAPSKEAAKRAPGDILNPRPFGAALFDQAVASGAAGANPDYKISPGDAVMVRQWGSVNADVKATVDQQGNIFIPQVGPVPLSGVRAGDLSDHVARHVHKVYQDNVEVYTTLEQWHPLGVFVSGYVKRPGRFLGTSTDSVLEFLGRAGGIDETKGSFRDIRIIRNNEVVEKIDLYDFLIDGTMPKVTFRDGDTVMVGAQRPTVAASGSVRNAYKFETSSDNQMDGAELVRLSRPLPEATHAKIQGTRDGKPWAEYVPLAEAKTWRLHDQDRVSFAADAASRTLTIEVVGAKLGHSVFVVDPSTTFLQMLDMIEADPVTSDIASAHIRRQSVARQQKASLKASLDRLERAVLNTSIMTDGEAQIRKTEAELVTRYIDRARTVEPDGTVVVRDGEGKLINLRLEDGDQIVIPHKSGVVTVSGEVMAPQTIAFEKGKTAAYFLERAGGMSDRGDSDQIIIRKLNGQVALVSTDEIVTPGDEILALPKVEFKSFQFGKDLFQIIYQIAVSAGVLVRAL